METAGKKGSNGRALVRPAPCCAAPHGGKSLTDPAIPPAPAPKSAPAKASATATAKPPRRSHAEAREQAMNQIIDIATQEFVEKGLAGARIDEIAGRATKRKIYYYFDGKDELYRAVLERAYQQVRDSEGQVDITAGSAADALRRLIEHDVRYHSQHPELVRLVMNENIHRAEHLKQIPTLPAGNQRVIDILRAIIARGEAEGTFRTGIDPVELHMNMTALSFYNVSNQFTFGHNFGIDMTSPAAIDRRAQQVADIIIAWVTQKD